jgi:hypothetical protein
MQKNYINNFNNSLENLHNYYKNNNSDLQKSLLAEAIYQKLLCFPTTFSNLINRNNKGTEELAYEKILTSSQQALKIVTAGRQANKRLQNSRYVGYKISLFARKVDAAINQQLSDNKRAASYLEQILNELTDTDYAIFPVKTSWFKTSELDNRLLKIEQAIKSLKDFAESKIARQKFYAIEGIKPPPHIEFLEEIEFLEKATTPS